VSRVLRNRLHWVLLSHLSKVILGTTLDCSRFDNNIHAGFKCYNEGLIHLKSHYYASPHKSLAVDQLPERNGLSKIETGDVHARSSEDCLRGMDEWTTVEIYR
jgi:hypothetical protein